MAFEEVGFKEDRLDDVESYLGELKPGGERWTHTQIGEKLGVSSKTIQRYAKELEKRGRRTKAHIPSSREMDDGLERLQDTFGHLSRQIRRIERYQEELEREIGFEGDWDHDHLTGRCKTCGRLPLRTNNPLMWQNLAKFGDTANAQLTTLMKALGQIQDNPLLVVQQQDEDFTLIIAGLSRVGQLIGAVSQDEQAKLSPQQVLALIAREVYEQAVARSERRRIRLPEFMTLVEREPLMLEGESKDE